MRIYHRPGAGRPLRTVWTFEELGAPYELVTMTPSLRSYSALELGRRNPITRPNRRMGLRGHPHRTSIRESGYSAHPA